jgi:hypothetical protein
LQLLGEGTDYMSNTPEKIITRTIDTESALPTSRDAFEKTGTNLLAAQI